MSSVQRIRTVLEKYFGAAVAPELAARFEARTVHGGEWLFRQGDPGDSLYLLARGRLQAWLEPVAGGPPQLLGEVAPGDSVGEMSLLSGLPRSASIRAVRDSLLVRIDRAHFDAVAAGHPALVMQLAANVVNMSQNSGRGKRGYRRPRTVAVVPLDSAPRTLDFGRQLAASLGQAGSLASLDAGAVELHSPGGPGAAGEVSDSLREWLHDQEDAHDFTLFQCGAGGGVWTELAQRQADLVLFVADGRSDPAAAANSLSTLDDKARHALVLLQAGRGHGISGTSAWLDALAVDYHLHVREDVAEDLARVARVVSGQAVGLVLAAGAARGFAHIGVYRAMRELGVPVDWIGGASIGSIMGAAMAADWDMERILDTARQSFVEGKPFSDYTMPVTSLISGKRMNRLLQKHLDLEIEDLPIPFFCVSAVLDDGRLNVHRRGNTARALAASAALPGVLPPAVVNRRLTIDGSVLNSMPVDIMEQQPVGRVIAVDLSSDKEYRVDYQRVPPAWKILAGRYLPFLKRYRVPALATVLLKATEIGTLARMRELGARADLLLRPDVRGFGITEVRTFDRIVEAGYRCAMDELPAWQERAPGGRS